MRSRPERRAASAVLLLSVALTACDFRDSVHDLVGREDFAQVQARLDARPDLVNAPSQRWHKTPLFYAVTYGVPKMIDLLVARGADVNAADVTGMRPLHSAAIWDKDEEAACLIAHGADVAAVDKFGDTPLHLAAIWGREDVAKVFLAHGASLGAKNSEGLTPLQLAQRYRRKGMVEFLEQAVGTPSGATPAQ